VSTPEVVDGRPIVLAIQNDPTDPPLLVGEWLAEDGVRVLVVEAYAGADVPTEVPDGVHGVLAMGGAMGANDDEAAPWLPAERALLADAVAEGVPVLGLCLGGQLLAAATGGRVELGPTQEIGLVDVQRTVEGVIDPVIGQAVPARGVDIPAAQWHQDHITELPDGAVLLLTNSACRVQAFRLGDAAYGLQLHPELDGAIFRSWADYGDEALERSGVDPLVAADDVEAADADLVAAWRPVTRAWGELVWARSRDRAGAGA
jgi:GMP synthase-like glutamine amidotransferase